jgi:DNA polymerase II large subunit
MLNAPLTHFKPKEIGLTAKKAKELGYRKDVHGKELTDDDQIIELFLQDIIINENAGDFFVRVCQFVDDELEKFYSLPAYHKITSRSELMGELVLSLAPHTSAAVVGRIIGFTKARVCFAHPFYHLAKRRNCDGEQDSVMLLTDAMLNFSQKYLSSKRGGRMDAPLVFTVAINPTEIDDEAHDMEYNSSYPLEFYEKAQQYVFPEIDTILKVKDILGTEKQYSGIGFTHDTTAFDAGLHTTKYILLDTMESKINAQAELQSKIRAVDKKDALERVLVSHFLPDIIGNSRQFSKQKFRCTKCNETYRRIPLNGKCRKCSGGNIILTIAQGSVRKYLNIAKNIVKTYGLSAYLKQRIKLIEEEVDSVFSNEAVTQKSLSDFI